MCQTNAMLDILHFYHKLQLISKQEELHQLFQWNKAEGFKVNVWLV